MAKILITGANGQLGQSLLHAASRFPNHHLIGFDLDRLDIADMDAVHHAAKSFGVQMVINCAAYTNVDKAEAEPDPVYAVNKEAVRGLSTVCERLDITIIHLSTDYVFDGKSATPYTEDDKPAPLSVYGASKLSGEAFVLSYRRGVVVRTSWLYSPYGHNFVSTILRIGNELKEIKVVNDQTGSPTYAPHLADALLQIATQIEDSSTPESLMGLYHYANSGACTRFDFAQKIKEYAPFQAQIVPVLSSAFPTPAHRPPYSVLETKKITKTFGIVPPPWENGLKTYLI